MHVLASFENDRLEATHKQSQCSEHSGRSGTYDDHRFGRRYILIIFQDIILHHLIRLVDFYPVPVKDVISCIYRAAHDAVLELALYLGRSSESLDRRCKYLILGQFLSELACYFYLFHN